MGSLTLDTTDAPLDLRKVVISIWYRIPSSVASALTGNGEVFPCAGTYSTGPGEYITDRTVPLITFGTPLFSSVYNFNSIHLPDTASPAGGLCPATNYTNWDTSPSGITQATPPTFIGVHINNADETGAAQANGRIVVNIQPNDKFASTGLEAGAFNPTCTAPVDTSRDWTFDDSVDQSYADEYYDNFGGKSVPGSSFNTWHHLLISWDVTNGTTGRGAHEIVGTDEGPFILSVSKMWMALDGVNYNGTNLPAVLATQVDIGGGLSPFGPNDITSALVSYWAGVHDQGLGADIPLELAVTSVPSNPVKIPGSLTMEQCDGTTVNPSNQNVEMYRPQIWTGITLDTSVEANRRLFLGTDRRPVAQSVSEAALGVPNIVFKNATNFRAGINTGTAGNFTVSDTINPFSPGPGG